jgi:hypothetical protein
MALAESGAGLSLDDGKQSRSWFASETLLWSMRSAGLASDLPGVAGWLMSLERASDFPEFLESVRAVDAPRQPAWQL